jgi:hypothetical protein
MERILFFRSLNLGFAFFFIIGSFNITNIVINSIVVKQFGADGIPLTDLLKAFTASLFCGLILYHKYLGFRLSTVVIGFNCFCLVYLAVFPVLYSFSSSLRHPLTLLLALAGSSLITSGVYCVWMLMTSTVPRAEAAYYTVFAALPQVAVIITAYLVQWLNTIQSPEHLLWLGAIGYLIAFSLILIAMLRSSCAGGQLHDFTTIEYQASDQPLRSLGRLLARPYIFNLCLIIIAQVAFGTMLSWRIYQIAAETDSLRTTTNLLSHFSKYVGWISLICQLIIVPLVFRFLTPRGGIFLLPILGFILLASIGAGLPPLIMFISIAIYVSLDYTLNNCMRESLYVPLPLHVKVHFKAVLAILSPRIGAILSALLLLAVHPLGMKVWYVGLSILVGLWITSAFNVIRLYNFYLCQADNQVWATNVDEICTDEYQATLLPLDSNQKESQ